MRVELGSFFFDPEMSFPDARLVYLVLDPVFFSDPLLASFQPATASLSAIAQDRKNLMNAKSHYCSHTLITLILRHSETCILPLLLHMFPKPSSDSLRWGSPPPAPTNGVCLSLKEAYTAVNRFMRHRLKSASKARAKSLGHDVAWQGRSLQASYARFRWNGAMPQFHLSS